LNGKNQRQETEDQRSVHSRSGLNWNESYQRLF
jgi:hypothetical protein